MNEAMVEILVPLGFFAAIVLLVWVVHLSRNKAKDRQSEVVRQMIDKFSTGEAFAEAIQGPESEMLVRVLALEDEGPRKKTWIGIMIPAFILTFLGIGFFVLSWVESDGFIIPAIVIEAVGLALALASYIIWRIEERGDDRSGEGGEDVHGAVGPQPQGDIS